MIHYTTNMNSKYLVYGLIDPRTNELRYIGMSSSGTRRPLEHTKADGRRGETHRAHWLRSLYTANGLIPSIIILGYAESRKEVCAFEVRMIALFRELGFNLTNISNGGDGGGRFKPHTAESKLKMRNARLGKATSTEVRKKISAANAGRRLNTYSCKRMSEAHKGKPRPPYIRMRIAVGQKRNSAIRKWIRTELTQYWIQQGV